MVTKIRSHDFNNKVTGYQELDHMNSTIRPHGNKIRSHDVKN